MRIAALRSLLIPLLLALVAYLVCFGFIQHRRLAKGPWEVTFTSENGKPVLVINQAKLGLSTVRIVLTHQTTPTNLPQTLRFARAQPVPFDLPFGQCVFLDPLFLPGTVVVEAFGHRIQLMPRVLTLDRVEHRWHSGETIILTDLTNSPPKFP